MRVLRVLRVLRVWVVAVCVVAYVAIMAVVLAACGDGAGSIVNGAAAGSGTTGDGSTSDSGRGGVNGKLKVCVTFDAMKEFAEAVGGDRVDVLALVPAGMEPHDFEPKAHDLAELGTAHVLVYNGLGMEAWVDEAVAAAGNARLVAVEASAGAEALEGDEEGFGYDPHLWLSLQGAQLEAGNIRDAFAQADPANATVYERNCAAFTARLAALHDEYAAKFAATAKKSFVTGHAAFGYLCREFGLEQNSVEDLFAEGEPTARQLAELVEYCKAHGVTTVFAESMASPDVSQTLANEIGAAVETVYTIESAEDGLSYLQRMESNLSRILASLS